MGVQKAKRLFQKNGVCLQKKQKVFVKEVQKAKRFFFKKNVVFFKRDALFFITVGFFEEEAAQNMSTSAF